MNDSRIQHVTADQQSGGGKRNGDKRVIFLGMGVVVDPRSILSLLPQQLVGQLRRPINRSVRGSDLPDIEPRESMGDRPTIIEIVSIVFGTQNAYCHGWRG